MAVQTASVQQVIDRMVAIEQGFGGACSTDGVACFNRLYLAVTRAVEAAIRDDTFQRPMFVARLDVDFADLYFDALDASQNGDGAPAAWRPLFKKRSANGIAPLQFALAGMNAHINHDLPQALLATWTVLGKPDRDSPEYEDYEEVNDILERVEREVKANLESEALAEIDDLLGKSDDAFAIWSVKRARDLAWTAAEALWELRDRPDARRTIDGIIAGLVGFSANGLLR